MKLEHDMKLFLKTLVPLILAGMILGATITWATTPTTTFYISTGVYPGAPYYTIWTEGTGITQTYYAKRYDGYIPTESGSTNASYVIQNAITDGDSVLIKDGTYIFGNTLVITGKTGFSLFGESWGSILYLANNTNKNMLNITSSSHVDVKNLKFDGNYASQTAGHGVYVTLSLRTTIENCKFWHVNDDAIRVEAATYTINTRILYNSIEQISGNGIYLGNYASDTFVMGNDVGNCTAKGLVMEQGATASLIDSNTFWSNSVGIYGYQLLSGIISNNRVDYNLMGGIWLNNCRSIELSGNDVYYNSMALSNTYPGVRISGTYNSTFIGIMCQRDEWLGIWENQNYGILEDTSSNYNIIIGCHTRGLTKGITKVGANTQVHLCYNNTAWID